MLLFHCHQIPHTRSPVSGTPDLALFQDLMTVEEAKDVCKDRSKWKEVISAYPKGKRA
jgi:hypothetical protein